MNARAAFVMLAPKAIVRTIENPVLIRPEAIMAILSFRPAPIKKLRTTTIPSSRGNPTELESSGGAAPVPPSAPSTVIKSGPLPVSRIAKHKSAISPGSPTQSLIPTGRPPLRLRSFSMNPLNS